MFKFIFASLIYLISFNAHAWTSIAYGKNTDYVYASTSYQSQAESEKAALQGCAKVDNNCEISISDSGAKKVLSMVRYEDKKNNGIYVATSNDFREAEKNALSNCKKGGHLNCYVQKDYFDGVNRFLGVGFVNGKALINTIYTSLDRDEAKVKALENCKKQSDTPELCKSDFYNDTTYFAYAKSTQKDDDYYGYAIAENQEKANQMALNSCQEGKRECFISLAYRSSYVETPPKELQVRISQLDKSYEKKQLAKAKQTEKPQKVSFKNSSVNRTSCENSCSNGNCIRTLPDGTQERWQAPRTFDPFTQNWTWDTNTNACGA